MSKLDELIQELCPDGVEFRKLGEISQYCKERIDASTVDKTCYVGVENLLQNKQGKTLSSAVPTTGQVIAFSFGDILIGNIRPYLKKIWLADCNGGTNGDVLAIHITDSGMLPEFLYYVLSSDSFFHYDMQYAKGSKMPRGSKEAVLQYVVPVPPIPVQHEIVRILDTFTELTSELTENLSKELTARKQQYSYYRDKMLTFANGVKQMTIADICRKVVSGGTPPVGNSDYYGGSIPWLRTQEVDWKDITDTAIKITDEGLKNSSAKWIPANCVIVAMYGATAAKVAINKIPLTTNQACCNLEIDSDIALYRYVFHWLCKEYLSLKGLGQGSQSNINAQTVKQYKIPIPPIPVQQRLVTVLDNFDVICSDLNIGLPAEIEARKKQYEFYRDQLLTFAAQDEIVLTDRQTDRQTDEYNALIRLCQYVFGYVTLEISDICNISRGKVISKTDIMEQAGTYPVYSSQTENNGELGKIDSYMFDGEYVTWTTDGANAGTVFYRYGKFNITNVCGLLSVMDSSVLLEKYLFYFLQKNAGKYVNAGMGNPKLMSNVMASIKIDIPSLSEQKRIIAILDHFSTLCTDLTSGLPAEIEARQKQYEYYRDNLLSFTPAD